MGAKIFMHIRIFYSYFFFLIWADRKLPKNAIQIPSDPDSLPFFPVTHMFVKKVECLAVRHKPTDWQDLVYLWDHFAAEFDLGKIKMLVTAEQRDTALGNHSVDSKVVQILRSLNVE